MICHLEVVRNEVRQGMSIFYMLCSKDKKQGRKEISLDIIMKHVFAHMGDVWPFIYVINKNKTSLNAIVKVTAKKTIFF